MRTAILDALEARYEAQVAEADAIINIYLENSVGIGEHPQHIEEIDKQIQKIMRDSLQRVGDAMVSGGVDNMEKYQYMLGQARTYQIMLQEISNLLDNKEQKEDGGNIVSIKGDTKNPLT